MLGAGNMATAIVKGIISSEICPAENIFIYDIMAEKVDALCKMGCSRAENAAGLVSDCETVVLAVKPQNFPQLLSEIKDFVSADKLFVSIAAGISIEYIKSSLGVDLPVVRVMPNTPMLLSCGATVLSRRQPVTDEQFAFVKGIFESCGTVTVLDEDKINASIAIHSSSPAFLFLFAKVVCETAQQQGIDPNDALALFAQTMIGSANMLLGSGLDCDQLIKMVTSPGGTTQAALEKFDELGFDKAINQAMLACTKRAQELGK